MRSSDVIQFSTCILGKVGGSYILECSQIAHPRLEIAVTAETVCRAKRLHVGPVQQSTSLKEGPTSKEEYLKPFMLRVIMEIYAFIYLYFPLPFMQNVNSRSDLSTAPKCLTLASRMAKMYRRTVATGSE